VLSASTQVLAVSISDPFLGLLMTAIIKWHRIHNVGSIRYKVLYIEMENV